MNIKRIFDEHLQTLPEELKQNSSFQNFLSSVEQTLKQTETSDEEQLLAIQKQAAEDKENLQLLINLVSSFHSGVLVENELRQIIFTNQLFCDIFSIPVPLSWLGNIRDWETDRKSVV